MCEVVGWTRWISAVGMRLRSKWCMVHELRYTTGRRKKEEELGIFAYISWLCENIALYHSSILSR